MLDHTVSRLTEIPGIIPLNLVGGPDFSMTLTSKYGCDGPSGHNPYNQSFIDSSKSDASVLIFSMVALALEMYDSKMSMVDGKVCQALTKTPSSQSYYICDAKASMMNKLEEVKLLPVKIENYSFGLSTLHAWIRFMKCILHIEYRSDFCK